MVEPPGANRSLQFKSNQIKAKDSSIAKGKGAQSNHGNRTQHALTHAITATTTLSLSLQRERLFIIKFILSVKDVSIFTSITYHLPSEYKLKITPLPAYAEPKLCYHKHQITAHLPSSYTHPNIRTSLKSITTSPAPLTFPFTSRHLVSTTLLP